LNQHDPIALAAIRSTIASMAQKDNSDIGQMPFERAIEELESIVKRLEEGKVPLEESVAIYERGEGLKRRCEDLLGQAAGRVARRSPSMRPASRPGGNPWMWIKIGLLIGS